MSDHVAVVAVPSGDFITSVGVAPEKGGLEGYRVTITWRIGGKETLREVNKARVDVLLACLSGPMT